MCKERGIYHNVVKAGPEGEPEKIARLTVPMVGPVGPTVGPLK